MEAAIILGVIVFFVAYAIREQFSEAKKSRDIKIKYIDSDPKVRERIQKKMVWIGMTEAQLIDSWGQPNRKSKRLLKTKIKDTYYYGSIKYSSKVYLENGRVVGWTQ